MRRAVPPSFNVEFMTAATAASQPAPVKAEGALAVRAAARAFGRHQAGQARDQSFGRRAAAPDSAVRRTRCSQAHLERFRPLSGEQGHRGLPQGRRGLARPALPAGRPVDPRDRSPGAERHARGPVPRRRSPPSATCRPRAGQAGDPDPQSVLRRLFGRRRRRRLRAGLSADHARNRLPARSRRDRRRRCSRAPSPSISPRRRTRRARSPTTPISTRLVALARRFGFLVFADECYCEIYLNGRPPPGMLEASAAGLRQRRRVPLAVEALQPARAARRLRRRRPPLPRAASSSCATSRRRRCRCRRRRSRSRPMATRPMSRRTARSTSRNSISPTRSSATATATSVRPAASSSGST